MQAIWSDEGKLESQVADLAARDDPAVLERSNHLGKSGQDAVEGRPRGLHRQDPGLFDVERDPFSNDGDSKRFL